MRRLWHHLGPLLALLAVAQAAGVVHPLPAHADDVAGPLRFVASEPGASVRLEARFRARSGECPANQPRNLHAAYRGILEVGRRADGRLYLVTELTFPEYLRGIDEVPRSWPPEALKAQVVGARTYAEAHMNPSTRLARELNYNLCATDACQVYRGLRVERGPWGDAWARAVDETAGEILEYEGKAASTFYFSTSNGRTYSNADVFGGSPLPYLVPRTESDDASSPFSSWSVRIPLDDLAAALRRAGSWGAGPVTSVVQVGDSGRIGGPDGVRSISLSDLRGRLNKQAPCLEPKRYPTNGSNGRPLPQVVPSRWFDIRTEGTDAVLTGRGWGHGVGMVQYGVKGKADRGMGYRDILAFYYGGLRPVRRPEPGQIRVGLAVDIEEIALEREGAVGVEGASPPKGPLAIRGGDSISIEPGSPVKPVLVLANVSPGGVAGPGSPATISFELSSPATVSLLYRGPQGAAGSTPAEPRDRGPQTLTWDPVGAGLPGGDYEASVVAESGVDRVVSSPAQVRVSAPPPARAMPTARSSAPPRSRATQGRGALRWVVLVAGAMLALAATAVLVFKIRR
ncbi:MAG: SpoIID/LytB domain-containing protein [Actinomycetota bacterium]